jgi:hypothetical protein
MAITNPWLVILCPYFGRWPSWINFFIESCKWNPEVQWLFYTDCGQPDNRASNVHIMPTSFNDYKALVRDRLCIAFNPSNPYKLCDLRPCLGWLHEREIVDFSFFGFGDIDVIYGNISKFYSPVTLADLDVISHHADLLSGHLALFRNTPDIRHAFERIPRYREFLAAPNYANLDEVKYMSVFFDPSATERKRFAEAHSNNLGWRGWHDGTMNYPNHWFWRRGSLTNECDGDRDFLYLHFIRWKSALPINNPPLLGESAWVGRDIIHTDWQRAATEGFCISAAGITAIGREFVNPDRP